MPHKNLENDLLKDIQSCMFDKIGHFRLIDEDIFGTERRYYIPKDEFDNSFNVLLAKQKELLELYRCNSDFLLVKAKKKDIETHLKKMSDRIVQVRLKRDQNGPLSVNEPYFDLNEISLNSYSFEKGVALENDEIIL